MNKEEKGTVLEPTPPTNSEGTGFGCACVCRDARNCTLMRYGWCGDFGRNEACGCLCHQWESDDE